MLKMKLFGIQYHINSQTSTTDFSDDKFIKYRDFLKSRHAIAVPKKQTVTTIHYLNL